MLLRSALRGLPVRGLARNSLSKPSTVRCPPSHWSSLITPMAANGANGSEILSGLPLTTPACLFLHLRLRVRQLALLPHRHRDRGHRGHYRFRRLVLSSLWPGSICRDTC